MTTKWTNDQLWLRFKKYYTEFPSVGLAMDLSRMNFDENFFPKMEPAILDAFRAMDALEGGAIANPDEKRMVGHYWLRHPSLAPNQEIRQDIEKMVANVKKFAAQVHRGELKGAGGNFKKLLVIGIGGSALGPQFVANALGNPGTDQIKPFFFDNTDPDGTDKVLATIGKDLDTTLCLVISKSGDTQETRNGMLEAQAAYQKAKLDFARHAVAITGVGSRLGKIAETEQWLGQFPMWDWVGGRTSELSAVGLLPAALQGIDIDALLAGAKACDEVTRTHDVKANPSALLSLMWYYSGDGKGAKDMVILPYKDRLELFSRYLQQLIMESLGKELSLAGQVVRQGIAVYGNKGSTDQHAYVQQLRDGLPNFFVTFIEVLKDRGTPELFVEPQVTSGDYLSGFMHGTRHALYENGRESITLTIKDVSPFSVGVLIALYERAVGYYATLVNINAYHQPGVQAGKKAATNLIALKLKVLQVLKDQKRAMTVDEIFGAIYGDEPENIFQICEHLAANPDRGLEKIPGTSPLDAKYRVS